VGDIDKAERVSMQRAIIFYLLAIVLVFSLVITGRETDPVRLLPWFVTIGLAAANIFTVGLLRSRRLKALVNDESTRQHRAMAITSGFWAALVAALLLSLLATLLPMTAILTARTILTATLVATLVSFATLELRAAR